MRIYTWDNYDDPAVFKAFEEKTGVRVVVDHFGSNEELLAKLMGGARGFDVIVPSDYMVSVLAKQGLLRELDKAKLPNLKNMDPAFLGLYYDPGNRYCAPYLWGMTGIAYDRAAVKDAPDSWAVLWEEKHAGRISLLNDQREVFAMALQAMGKPANSRDPELLREAQKRLKEQKRLVKTYNSENNIQLLVSGEVSLAHAWSGDVRQAAVEKPSLEFVVPKEGGFLWQDNLCVPEGAANPEAALQLIDFLMEPANAAKLVEKTLYGTPNAAARELLPAELKKDPTIVPDPAALKKMEWIHDVGEAGRVYDRLWTELKAG